MAIEQPEMDPALQDHVNMVLLQSSWWVPENDPLARRATRFCGKIVFEQDYNKLFELACGLWASSHIITMEGKVCK